jgi:hypothetical protein
VASAATTANRTHAILQLSPARSATGAASATPHPVPALIAVSTRLRLVGGRELDTTSENGGKTRPALAPATSRPANRTAGLPAAAATSMPTTAQHPPATTTARAPARTTSAAPLTDAAM